MKPKFLFFLLCAAFLITTNCDEKKAKTIYLIPQGFEGEVVITYDAPGSQSPLFENGVRVITINPSGKVESQHKSSVGVADDVYFFVSSNGSRKAIPFDHETDDPNKLCIYGNVTSSRKINGKEHHIEAFLVIRKKEVEAYRGYEFDFQ